MLKVIAVWIVRLLLAMFVSLLILAAVYVSIGRYYIGYVEQYQQQLVAQFIERSGLSLHVGNLSGRWSKLAPILTVNELTIFSDQVNQESVLSINNLSFKINPIQSLLKRSIQIQHLYIDGVRCSLLEAEPGHWQLKGYPIEYQGGGDVDKLVDLLLSISNAELLNAQVTMSFFKGSEALLLVNELSLKHSDDFRRIRLLASFDESEHPLTAIVEAQGDPRKQLLFSAQAYLKLDDIDFSAQLPMLEVFGVNLGDAQVDAEIWLDWLPNTQVSVQGKIVTPVIDIAALSGEKMQPLKNVAISFRAEKTSDYDWQGWVPSFTSQWQGQTFQFEQLQFSLGQNQLKVALPRLDVALLSGQLQAIDLLNDKLKDVINTLDAAGELENIWLTLFSPPAADSDVIDTDPSPRFLLTANLDNVEVAPWKAAPGASGVSGYIEIAPGMGKVELDSEQFSMQFPLVYDAPLAFDSIKGKLQWRIVDDRVLLKSGPLQLTADHGPATVLLDLDLPTRAGAEIPPAMTLTVGITDTDASYRNKFIPFTLNDNFLQWMKHSVPAGHVNHGGFIYRGSLRKGDNEHRTVQLYFDIDNIMLDYHEDWPALTGIAGLVEINDAEVRVNTTEAKLYELTVPAAVVDVKPEAEGGMWLTVNASANGNARDGLRVVNESAVRKLVGDVFSQWQLSGDVAADVTLGIPLAGASKAAEVDVQVQLANADLAIPEYRLNFSGLGGKLRYNSELGLSSDGLAGQMYNKPLTVAVTQDANKVIQVLVNGRIAMHDVEQWSQQAAIVFTEGETDFNALFTIGDQGRSELTMKSNLQGITLDLPAPFYKKAERAQPFWLSMPLSQDPLLRMGLSKQAELQLQFNEGSVESGLLVLGKADNYQHESKYLTVTGSVDSFVLSQWQPVLQRYLLQQQVMQDAKMIADEPLKPEPSLAESPVLDSEFTDASMEKVISAAKPSLEVKVRQLQLGEFSGFDQQFNNAVVDVNRTLQAWSISAVNERLEGEILLPELDQVPIKVALKRLQLPEGFSENVSDSENKQPFMDLLLDVSIEQLSVGEELYGSLVFDWRSKADTAMVKNIYGNIRGITIEKEKPFTLEWLRNENGDSSRLFGEFFVADLSDVLGQWNYQKVISSKKGQAAIDLSWPGSPDQWQLQTSSGNIKLKLENGRFLKASDTAAGTLKVVGIVNFMNIVRRLQLDFSDLYKSGISFDKIQGEAILADSQLKIIDELKVTSPSSKFYLRGDADLIAKQLNMELIATLPVASNLPWIVALAGGLPTAAGVYVASKIFEDQMDSFSSAIYSVKGDWNNPDMEFKRIFDDGKKTKSSKTTTDSPPSISTEQGAATNPVKVDSGDSGVDIERASRSSAASTEEAELP